MMAIGAMILGAKGIRRWKAKQQSTCQPSTDAAGT